MLAQDFHDAPVRGDVVVGRYGFSRAAAVRHLEDRVEPVRGRLVGTERPERVRIVARHVAQVRPQHPGRGGLHRTRRRNGDRVVKEIGNDEIAQQPAAVRVRIGAHAPVAGGGQRPQFGFQRAVRVEQLFRAIRAHPRFEDRPVRVVGARRADRNLMGTKRPFDRQSVHELRTGPALGRAEHDRGPHRSLGESRSAGVALNLPDANDGGAQRGRECAVHREGLVAGNEDRIVAAARQQFGELRLRDPREHRRAGDLVAVEMEDRKHGPVAHGIEKLVRVPARRQRARLRFAVADDRARDQIGIVENRAVRVR